MIKSFICTETEKIFNRFHSEKFPSHIQRIALRKLRMLNRAIIPNDFKIPPLNKPEILRGKRQGKFAVPINSNWKLCFRYNDRDLYDVEILSVDEIKNEQ